MRTLPSAPQLAKTSTEPLINRTSKTSLSWAINCVFAVRVGISQIVHVVSIELVMISEGLIGFQSRLVNGAVNSVLLEFESRASWESFLTCESSAVELLLREVMELVGVEIAAGAEFGRDHSRRWSPAVARRSVRGLDWVGGSQRTRVIG